MLPAVESNCEAIVLQTLRIKAAGEARRPHEADRAFLQYTGTHARQYVLLARPLQDQRVGSDAVQKLTEQQTGRPRADDDDLFSHDWKTSRPRYSLF